jgi:hypothetical protein
MGRSIERVAVGVLVFSVSILSIVGLFGIWGWLGSGIVWKSYTTIGILGMAALLVVGIARVSSKYYADTPQAPVPESGAWKAVRNQLLGLTGAVFLFFTALAILAVWEFVGKDALFKSFSSMMLLFVSAIINLAAFKSQIDSDNPSEPAAAAIPVVLVSPQTPPASAAPATSTVPQAPVQTPPAA